MNVVQTANMTLNTWGNLIGAAVMAAGGLTSDYSVFIVAAMLVSPLMGPILGMTFGLRIGDSRLFWMSFYNEVKMAITAFLVGCVVGVLLGAYGHTGNWPESALIPPGRGLALVVSIFVSGAAGLVLGISVTTGGVNPLVGAAMAAGLMPPIVSAGMLMAYAVVFADKRQWSELFGAGIYSLVWYATHVVAIIIVANALFWVKRIDNTFKVVEDEDAYLEIPVVQEYRRRMTLESMTLPSNESDTGFAGTLRRTANYLLDTVRPNRSRSNSAVSVVFTDVGEDLGITLAEKHYELARKEEI